MAEACEVDGTGEAGRGEAQERPGGAGVRGSDLRQVIMGDALKRSCDRPSYQVGYGREESDDSLGFCLPRAALWTVHGHDFKIF